MKLAYIILAYKDVELVSRLIDQLRTDGSTFIVHVCKNAGNRYTNELKKLQKGQTDVYFCKRERGTHFYFGLVKGTLNGLKFLNDNKIDYDYVNLISGQDYPIKTKKEILDFFKQNNGKQFMTNWPIFPSLDSPYFLNHPWGSSRQIYRIDRYHIKFNGKVHSIPEIESGRLTDHNLLNTLKIFLYNSVKYIREGKWKEEFILLLLSRTLPRKRKLPEGISLYGGSTWWSITRACAEHILETNRKKKIFNSFFKYTLIPDEMYFQTHVMNSPFKNNIVNNNLRFITWGTEDKTHPIIYTKEHFKLLKNADGLFARKFDIKKDKEIIEKLDTFLKNKEA